MCGPEVLSPRGLGIVVPAPEPDRGPSDGHRTTALRRRGRPHASAEDRRMERRPVGTGPGHGRGILAQSDPAWPGGIHGHGSPTMTAGPPRPPGIGEVRRTSPRSDVPGPSRSRPGDLDVGRARAVRLGLPGRLHMDADRQQAGGSFPDSFPCRHAARPRRYRRSAGDSSDSPTPGEDFEGRVKCPDGPDSHCGEQDNTGRLRVLVAESGCGRSHEA